MQQDLGRTRLSADRPADGDIHYYRPSHERIRTLDHNYVFNGWTAGRMDKICPWGMINNFLYDKLAGRIQ